MSKQAFLNSMRALLGADYACFESTLDEPAFRGVYVNTLKCSPATLQQLLPFALTPTPFSKNGFYLPPETQKIGTHPLHHAGAFYAQEPSAMSVATVLDAQPGDTVLDLCAAPGGKTAAIAGALQGSGLLWSNECVKSRAFTLLSNCERIGVCNTVISNTSAKALAAALPGFFDKVLVDAPCSGEGMLRKEKAAYADWSEKNIAACAVRQASILDEAAKLVRGGGIMVYSTCTFNRAENEQTVSDFLQTHPDFHLVPIPEPFGSPGFDMPQAKRIFPKDGGEGHFVAKLQKSEVSDFVKFKAFTTVPPSPVFDDFYQTQFCGTPYGNVGQIGEKIYLFPPALPQTHALNILRAGVLAGEVKHNRFLPAHHLYTAAHHCACRNELNFAPDDTRLLRYLHGEEIDVAADNAANGYCAVRVAHIPLGFGKISGGKLKNHYPKGLRNLS